MVLIVHLRELLVHLHEILVVQHVWGMIGVIRLRSHVYLNSTLIRIRRGFSEHLLSQLIKFNYKHNESTQLKLVAPLLVVQTA